MITKQLTSSITWLALACVLFLQMLSVPCSEAQKNNAATVIAVRGEVTASAPDGTTRKLSIKDAIYLEDTLDTGSKGRLQLMFSDNTIISLGRKTIMKITGYTFDDNRKGALSTKVNEGVFRVMGGILTKTSPENFSTVTPSGNIGIRGSLYTGRVAGQDLSVVFEGGKGITVQNATGTVVITTPGQGIRTSGFDRPISKPFRYTLEDLGRMHSELSFSSERQESSRPPGSRRFQPPVQFNPDDAGPPPSQPQGPDESADNEPGQEPDAEQAVEESDATAEEIVEENLLDGVDPNDPVVNEIVTSVRSNQNDAASIFKNAVNTSGMNVENALSVVLSGMKNTTRQNFDRLMGDAIDMGLTPDQAKDIVAIFKASGGVCK